MARPLFVTSPYVWVLLGVGLVLALREVLVRAYLGPGPGPETDVDSITVLWLATTPGTVLALVVPFTGIGTVPFPTATFWLGLTVMLAGFLLRLSALLTLGSAFTQHVAVREGHSVVERGPYRVVRHPAYTGAVLTYLGIGLALGNWLSLLAISLSALAGYGYRIRIEERHLRRRLAGYEAYAERTPYRLVPGVW